jgi:hypothetical protein
MIRIFATLALSFGAFSAHASTIDSAYPIGTTGDVWAQCTEAGSNVDGFDQYSCPLTKEASDAGYTLSYACYDHGCGLEMSFQGQSVDLLSGATVLGELSTKEFNVPANYEPSWHDGGVGAGALEVRYTITNVNGKTVKTPFAVIYREVYNTYSSLIAEDGTSSNEILSSTRNGLKIVKLDGANTQVIGMIDALKSKKANELARQCADSIVGQGNASACSSTLQPPFALD